MIDLSFRMREPRAMASHLRDLWGAASIAVLVFFYEPLEYRHQSREGIYSF